VTRSDPRGLLTMLEAKLTNLSSIYQFYTQSVILESETVIGKLLVSPFSLKTFGYSSKVKFICRDNFLTVCL